MSETAPQTPASPPLCRPFKGHRIRASGTPLSPDAQHRLAEFAPRITTVQEAEIDLDWNYLVDGWFLGSEASIVYAPSNLGKSTFVIDLASAVVSGRDWHGYATRRGSVLYVAAESAISIIERAKPLLADDAASTFSTIASISSKRRRISRLWWRWCERTRPSRASPSR